MSAEVSPRGRLRGAVLLLSTLVVLCALGGCALWRWARDRGVGRDLAPAALGAGLSLYCLYVIFIGGDFIVGRFWAAPLWVSILLLAYHASSFREAMKSLRWGGRAAAILVGCCLLLVVYGVALQLTLRLYGEARPAGLRTNAHVRLGPGLEWEISADGERFRQMGRAARESGGAVARIDPIGFAGIEAGRSVTIVDPYGLADPLIARLRPVAATSEVGHLVREIPRGYLLAKKTGSVSGLDPDLGEYVSRLRLITRGPLWSAERLATILRFQLGRYDHLLRRYESRRGRPGPEPGEAGPAVPEAQDRDLP